MISATDAMRDDLRNVSDGVLTMYIAKTAIELGLVEDGARFALDWLGRYSGYLTLPTYLMFCDQDMLDRLELEFGLQLILLDDAWRSAPTLRDRAWERYRISEVEKLHELVQRELELVS